MADIDITVGLNDRASRQLQNIDRAASSLTNTLRGAGAAAVAFASGSVVSGVISQYRAFERYRAVLGTYLGSQQAANEELRRLQSLANSLPQDLSDITEAFVIFNRFGLDTSTEALTAFSNLATANGKSFTQLGEAVADALTGEFERLKEFGIKVAKENDQFVARIGSQQVAVAGSTEDLVRQLQALGEEGGRFGSAAADNADTLNQSISNLQGAMFEASVTIGEELKPALKGAADEMARMLRDNEQLQKSIGVGLGEAIKVSAASVKLLADNIDLVRNAALAYLGLRFANAFVNLATKISSAVKASQSLGGMFSTMGGVISRNIPIIGNFGTALRTIGTYALRLAPLLTNPFTAIPAVIGAAVAGGLWYFQDSMITVGDTAASLGETVSAVGDIIGDAFLSAYRFVSEQAKIAFSNVVEFIKSIPEGAGNVVNYLGQTFESGFSYIRDLVSTWANSVRSYIAAISGPVKDVMDRVANGFRVGFNFVVNTVIATFTQINNIMAQMPEFIVDVVQSSANLFKSFGGYVIDSIASTFTVVARTIAQLPSFFVSAFQAVGTLLGQFGSAVTQKFSNIWEGIKLAAQGDFSAAMAKAGEEVGFNFGEAFTNSFANVTLDAGTTFTEQMRERGREAGFAFGEEFSRNFEDVGINLMDTSDIMDVDRLQQLGDLIQNTYGMAATYIEGSVLPVFQTVTTEIGEQANAVGVALAEAYNSAVGAIENKIEANRAEQAQMEAVAQMMEYEDAIMRQARLSSEDLATATDQVAAAQNNLAGAAAGATTTLSAYEQYLNNLVETSSRAANEIGYAAQAKQELTDRLRDGRISIDAYAQAMERINSTLGIVRQSSSRTAAAVNRDNKTIETETKTIADTLQERMMGLTSSISSTMTDVFLGLKGGFEGLEDIALSVVKTIVNTLVQEFLVKPLLTNISKAIGGAFGGMGGGGGLFGGGGGLFGMLGGLFGGGGGLFGMLGGLFGFADGGNTAIAGQKPILVGERGPEIFMPGKAGTVVSNEEIQGMGGNDQLVVNFNLNAIDTQTGTQFLLQNKQVITGVVQDAYRRRGQSGPLG